MPRRRPNARTSAQEFPQQPTATHGTSRPGPTYMDPLAYYNNQTYNEGIEGRLQTGLSFAGSPSGPAFSSHRRQQASNPMEDTLFEINQTGLSPMWRDPSPAYIDPRVGRPVMQARPPLPFQYITESPSAATRANPNPTTWETLPVDVHLRGQGSASSPVRQTALYQSLLGQPAPGEGSGTANRVPASQHYPTQPYNPYPSYPGPLAFPGAPLPGPTAYNPMQPEQLPVQATSPAPILVQLGASQNFLVNNRPARWIQVLDVDPSYQRARTPSPSRLPALSIYVRAPETEVNYWAVFLRAFTVQELIKRVVQKYGFSDAELERVTTAVRITDQGVQQLTDEDVTGMESEIAVDVKVTTVEGSEEWRLELRY